MDDVAITIKRLSQAIQNTQNSVAKYTVERKISMNEPIKYGDRVMCVTFPGQPRGFVIKQYYPTACPQQTQIICDDGRAFHAPTSDFVKI